MSISKTNAVSKNVLLQSKTVTPSASQQIVKPDNNYDGLSQVTVNGDANLVAGNIKSGTTIFGVTGNVNPAKEEQTKTVTFSEDHQSVVPDTNKVLNEVIINKPVNLISENIKKDVTIAGVTGTYEGGSSTSNYIYYDANQGDNSLIATFYAKGVVQNTITLQLVTTSYSFIQQFHVSPELDGDPIVIKCDNLPDNYKYSVTLSGDYTYFVSMAFTIKC